MSDTPVPIPFDAAPADAPAWNSADAAAWTASRPAPWARPRWSVLALVATMAMTVAAEPVPVCSEAAPCGPDWPGMLQWGLALGLLYWYVRLPELVLVAAPALAAMVVAGELPGAGGTERLANLAVSAALALGWAAAFARLTARRRQRLLAERAAGARHPLPEPVGPLTRGVLPVVIGLVLCAVAAGAVVLGLRGIHADERHAVRADRVTTRVTGRDDESVHVRTEDGRPLNIPSVYPEDYGAGTTVTVLEDGGWRRLSAESYDASGWQLLTLAAGLPGISLLAVGVLSRRRAAVLRRAPVPALRVRERVAHDGRTWVYAADDAAGRTPLFSCVCVPALGPEDEHGFWYADFGDPYDEDEPVLLDTRVRAAVMFGAPYEGAELYFRTAETDGTPLLIRTCAPVRLPRAGRGPLLELPKEPSAGHPADPAAGPLKPLDGPRHWGPGKGFRAAGAAFALIVVAGVRFFAGELAAEGFGWRVVLLLGPLTFVSLAATLLNWRITADASGLWLAGAWRVRHVPWERLQSAVCTREGGVRIRVAGEETWELHGLGALWLERLRRRPSSYALMADEITALGAHPELRPAGICPSPERGLPMGPPLLALTVVVALTAFL
ncbi:hypothetical protein ACFSL4_23705 [Streptomyces caeni]|uniref:PH domain-containing protein n=1 Tax=Streptomyces caeni TaxID=2307231 RepID=A0ABW4IUS3_9ACTN